MGVVTEDCSMYRGNRLAEHKDVADIGQHGDYEEQNGGDEQVAHPRIALGRRRCGRRLRGTEERVGAADARDFSRMRWRIL